MFQFPLEDNRLLLASCQLIHVKQLGYRLADDKYSDVTAAVAVTPPARPRYFITLSLDAFSQILIPSL